MALDTRSKRASALSAFRPYIIAPPLPDGLIDAADRKHLAGTYSGIDSTVVSIAVFDTDTAAEQVALRMTGIQVHDVGTPAESITLLLNPLRITVSETDTPTERVNVAPSIKINIADRDIVEDKDQATVRIPMKIEIAETGAAVEDTNVTTGRQISVFDQRHAFEVPTLTQSLRIAVADSDPPTEFVSLTSVAPRAVSVNDAAATAESVQFRTTQAPAVSDSVVAGEQVRLLVGFTGPAVSDTPVKSESVRILLSRLAINVSDSDLPTDVVHLPFTTAAPPATPASGTYAPTWLFDARQLIGTGMQPLELMFASRDIEQLDPPYRGRLIEEPVVTKQLMDTFWGFTEVSEITVKIANHDRRLVLLYRADPRDQPVILRRFDARTLELTDELYARITRVALETGAITISASSPQLGVFEREMPAPLVTEQQFPRAVDLGVPIPVVFGNVTKMPLPYVERSASFTVTQVTLPASTTTFLTDAGIHPPPQTEPYPYYNTFGNFGPNQIGFLAVGTSYVDPVFGSTIRRLTNELGQQSFSEIYGRNGYFNANGTRMHHRAPDGHRIIDPSTGAVVRSGINFTADSTFSPVDPDVWYYFAFGSTELKQYSIATGFGATIKTFAGPLEALGGSVDNIDRTGRYFVLKIGTTIRVWDRQTDTLYAGSIPDTFGAAGWIGLSPDGNYVITSTPGSPPLKHSFAINHATQTVSTTPVLFWTLGGDHGDIISASDGKTYFIGFDSNDTGDVYRVDVTLPQTHADILQQRTQNLMLLPLDILVDDAHMCAASTGAMKDWVFLSTEGGDDVFGGSLSGWRPYEQEIVMVNVLTGEIRRLAHHRSRSTAADYYYQPKISVSWDGRFLAVQSNYGFQAPGYADIYSIDTTNAAQVTAAQTQLTAAGAFDYLAGHGVLNVSAVYAVRPDGGYTLIPASEYVIATQAYPNLTVVRFPSRRVDAEGRDVAIVADVAGASRNVIRNIQSLLSDPIWGLKQPVDVAGFDAAAAQIDAVGLFCDGALLEQRQAQDVLREMMLFRGIRLGFTSQGEWTVTVDTPKTTIDLVLRDGVGDGARTILTAGERQRPSTADVISTYTVAYRQDFVKGQFQFRQQRTVNPNFGRERSIDNIFIRDHSTADKVIDYLAKRERFGAELVDLTIPQEGRVLAEGSLVEVTYPPMALSAQVMEVRQVVKRLETVSVLAAGWDPEIYTYSPGTLPFDPTEPGNTITIPPVGGLTVVLDDCDFVVTWQPVSEVAVGGDEDNLVPIDVKDYQVEVFVAGVLRRTEYVTPTTYTYTLDKNRIDNPPSGSRDVTFVVRARTFDGVIGDPNTTSGGVPTPSMSQISISVFDEPNLGLENLEDDGPTVQRVRDYVALSRGPIDVSDTGSPTESVSLVLTARSINVSSAIDGNNSTGMRTRDAVTVSLGRRVINVVDDDLDVESMEYVSIDFGPGRIIRVYDDAQAEEDFLEDGLTSNIRSSVVGIFVSDEPGAFGFGMTESVTVRRNPLLINVSDTRTITESRTVVRS